MKHILATVLAQACIWAALAQTKTQALTIGDSCPDAFFYTVVNAKPGLRLSDYKDRHIIICFVSPGCGLSHTMFPKLQHIQKQFGNELRVILVASSTMQQWNEIKSYNSEAANLSLVMALEDSVMENLFPHQFKPHAVWLDKNRKVKAITDWEYITPRNLRQFLDGRELNLPLKKDVGKYNITVPLITHYDDRNSRPSFYSMITPHLPGTKLLMGFLKDSLHNSSRFSVINAPVLTLFRISWNSNPLIKFSNRYLFEVRDRDKLLFDSSRFIKYGWDLRNTWCYEAVLPLSTSREQFYQKLRLDIEYDLGYSISEERRQVECLVLKKKDGRYRKQASKPRFKTISDLVELLNLTQTVPVIDETGITGSIALADISGNPYDRDTVEKYLEANGLQLVPETRELEMLIVREK